MLTRYPDATPQSRYGAWLAYAAIQLTVDIVAIKIYWVYIISFNYACELSSSAHFRIYRGI